MTTRDAKDEASNEGKYWWCGTCNHAYSLLAWNRSNSICPTPGCRAFKNSTESWESIYAEHPDYPAVPDPSVKYPR